MGLIERTYGNVAEDTSRCIVELARKGKLYQCTRKRGHGRNGLRCKQHAKLFSENYGRVIGERR